MNGILYTSWKDSLGVSHVDEPVATYENGKIYVAADGFFGTTRNGTLIGEYENGKVYSVGTGAFNYGKRLNLVAIIEGGKIYSVQRSILGGVSKSLSVGECSNGKVYSHSHKLMEGSESFGIYNGDEEGAAAAAAIALFKLKSDVSAYYNNNPAQESTSNDDDLWEKYGLLMPIVVTYRIFKYMFIACRWLYKVIIWFVSYITKVMQENKNKVEVVENVIRDDGSYNNDSEIQTIDGKFKENEINDAASKEVSSANIEDTNDMSIVVKADISLETRVKQGEKPIKLKINKSFVIGAVCLALVAFIVFLMFIKSNTEKSGFNAKNANSFLANKILQVEGSNSSYNYQLIYYDENGREIRQEGYDSEGALVWHAIIEYDQQGKRVSWIDFDANNVVYSQSEYIYDSEGNKIKTIIFEGDGEVFLNLKYVYEGNKVTELLCDERWNPAGANYFVEYYEGNKLIRRENHLSSDGSLVEYAITQYDKNGVKTETTEYDARGKLVAVTKYKIVDESIGKKNLQEENKKEPVSDTAEDDDYILGPYMHPGYPENYKVTVFSVKDGKIHFEVMAIKANGSAISRINITEDFVDGECHFSFVDDFQNAGTGVLTINGELLTVEFDVPEYAGRWCVDAAEGTYVNQKPKKKN